MSKEYVNELARNYYPTTNFNVQPYSEKFNSSTDSISSRFSTATTSSFNTGNWVDCWGTIVRVQSVITGNFDITNTGEFGRKLKFLFPTT
ncbi:MAG: hypothetical protein ACK5XN_38920, partial [Bacteroidota bacterium]